MTQLSQRVEFSGGRWDGRQTRVATSLSGALPETLFIGSDDRVQPNPFSLVDGDLYRLQERTSRDGARVYGIV